MISIIDIGMGNLWSLKSALDFLGYKNKFVKNSLELKDCKKIILPGVGSFKEAMSKLIDYKLDKAIIDLVQNEKIKILGICLGMQLLCESSTEDGYTKGLNLIPLKVEKFTQKEVGENKIPHIGFNLVENVNSKKLFKNLSKKSDFYFVHSYRTILDNLKVNHSICNYNINFVASLENENIFGTQFHPEKSQTNGLVLLKNFLEN